MKEKIHLTKEKETLLITLYAKAMDYRSKRSILNDRAAEDILKMIDVNLSQYKGFGSQLIVIRARQFDEWIRTFINVHSDAVVVYLGCGLDTRVERIKPSETIDWFDIDYPEVIDFRKSFFAEKKGYHMIGSSITDAAWLDYIPRNRPILILAEGVFEYLEPGEVKTVVNRLTSRFPHGQIMFDVMNSFAINSGKKKLQENTGAVHKWAVDDLTEIDKLDAGWKRRIAMPLSSSSFKKKLPVGLRIMLGIFSYIPSFKYMICLMLYDF